MFRFAHPLHQQLSRLFLWLHSGVDCEVVPLQVQYNTYRDVVKGWMDVRDRLSDASSTAILKFNAERIEKSILCDSS